jgi:C4-dicarboxylate-specific signal transduction histidine kinase
MSNAYGRAISAVDDQRAKLFEANRLSAIGSMACSVAHEINTPLMAMDIQINTLATNLEGAGDRAEDAGAIEMLSQLSKRIATIVRGFKLVSYSSADDPMTDITLGKLVESSVDILAGRFKPLGVKWTVDLANPMQLVRCRVVLLSQVILNALNNSCDAVADLDPNDRWVRVASGVAGDKIWISVTDSGRIESDRVKAHMFEPFFTTKPIGKGTGLGLTVSKETVDQHGGRLYFDWTSPTTKLVIELPMPAPNGAS